MEKSLSELKQELIENCKFLYELHLVPGGSGNVSFRYDNKIYITVTGSNLGHLTESDLAITDLTGNALENKPSVELAAHRALFDAHPDINAVVHVHGEFIAAYTCIADLEDTDYPAMFAAPPYKIIDQIPMAPYFHPHPVKNYDQYLEIAKRSKVFFHQNHGIFIGAKSISEGTAAAELLESNFKIYFTTLASGKTPRILSATEKLELFTRSYV